MSCRSRSLSPIVLLALAAVALVPVARRALAHPAAAQEAPVPPADQAAPDQAAPNQPAADETQQVRALFEAGSLDEAQALAETAIERSPANPQLHILLARIYLARAESLADTLPAGGTFARMLVLDALQAIERALHLDPKDPEAHALRAELLINEGRFDQAAQAARAGLALGERPDLLYLLALASEMNGAHDDAAAAARRCLELDPASVEAGIVLITALEKAGKRTEALSALEELARANPQRLDIASELWSLHGGQGDFKTAVAYYERLAKAVPDQAWFRFYLGATRRRADDLEGAWQDLEKALAIDPQLLDAQRELGLVLAREGRLVEAAQSLVKVVRVDGAARGEAEETLLWVAAALAQEFLFAEAIASYDAVLEADPVNYYAHINRALVLNKMGRSDDSLAAYAAAAALFPDDVTIMNDHGLVLLGLGRTEEAIGFFEKAARAGGLDGHENLAMLAWHAGDTKTCIEHLQEVIRREPDRAKALYYLELARRALAAKATPAENG
ncbi:MAG: tetratricopeptide repeat protein [Planctomycetota bacterium]